MKVLVACEESQVVCTAFRAKGHEAYSCDIQECSGGHPEWHIIGDALEVLYSQEWDLVIAHPPCTYLSNAASVRLYPGGKLNEERYQKGLKAKEFFMEFYNYKGKVCIENPIPSKIFELPKHTQQIEPFHFGHPFKKKTRLWLKGLSPLIPTNIVSPKALYVSRRGRTVAEGSTNSAKERSKTFHGIAWAMAEQWG